MLLLLFGTHLYLTVRLGWVIAVFFGSVLSLPIVWSFADIANALMAIPKGGAARPPAPRARRPGREAPGPAATERHRSIWPELAPILVPPPRHARRHHRKATSRSRSPAGTATLACRSKPSSSA